MFLSKDKKGVVRFRLILIVPYKYDYARYGLPPRTLTLPTLSVDMDMGAAGLS